MGSEGQDVFLLLLDGLDGDVGPYEALLDCD